MTTNSPNPVDGDVQALIEQEESAEAKLADLEKHEPIYQYMTVSMSDETWLQERWHDCTKEEFDDANSECAPVRIVYAQQQPKLVEGLHPETAELVMHFAEALAKKLRKSEQKYGWSDGWKDADWQEKCLADFNHHIEKGDPLDVAAYCAFMWFHGWQTRNTTPRAQLLRPVELPDCDYGAVSHMSGGSKDYCNGFVDGTNNAIKAIREAGYEVKND